MKPFEIIKNIFSKEKIVNINGLGCDVLTAEICLYELGLEMVAEIIGNSLVQTVFATYKDSKRFKGEMYHLFNVKPNKNQNAAEFRKQLAYKLVYDNEVLIIQDNEGYLHIANTFDEDDMLFYEKTYSNVYLADNFYFNRTFRAGEVIHLKWNNKKINDVLNQVYLLHGKALSRVMSQFHKLRGLFNLTSMNSFKDKTQDEVREIFQKKVADYFGDSNVAVMTLENGLSFSDNSKNEVKYEDIDSLIDRIFGTVFSAFLIPTSFIKTITTASTGSVKVTSNAMDQYLTMCLNPLVTLIATEFNSKLYTKKQYLEGMFLKIKTSNIKYTNMFDSASNIDILRRNGFSFNEILYELGEVEIEEEWASLRFITKNYELMQEAIERSAKNGEA